MNEWIKKMLYTNIMEYYSAIKKNLAICYMNGPWGHYAKLKTQKKTNTMQFHLQIWNLKQTHKSNKNKQARVIDSENRLVVARIRGRGYGWNRWRSQKLKMSCYKINKSWDVRYSMVTIVNNTVLHIWGFPGGSDGKESTCTMGHLG